jgi:hypothetical protein
MQRWTIAGCIVTFDDDLYSCDCIFFKRGIEVDAMGPQRVRFRCEHIRKIIIQEAKLRIAQKKVTEYAQATTLQPEHKARVVGPSKRAIKLD